MLFTVTYKIHLTQKMKLNREHFRAIIFFYNFRRSLTQQQCIDEFNSIFGDGSVFIGGMVNSAEVVVHSKTNFVKVVQNQLLLRKPLMLCAN